ncbi:MAG: hypothetical protein V2A76_18535 [Planctomycetota bacterium]
MDLNDIWQGNRRFILGICCAVVAVLIGEGIIGSMWNAGAQAQAVGRLQAKLRGLASPSQSDLSGLEGVNRGLAEQLEQLYGRLTYQVDERYLLPKNEPSPDLLYNSIRSQAQDELVGSAARRNIRVDETLGLPDFTPSGREAIQRALRGLNIVEQVVSAAIVAGVRSVPEIEIVGRKGSRRASNASFIDSLQVRFRIEGSTASVAELIQSLVRGDGQFLCVEDAEFDVETKRDFGLTRLRLVVSGLTIDAEAPVTGV